MTSTYELDGISIEVYPNPASQFIRINTKQDADISLHLYSIEGALVKELAAQIDNDVSELPKGVYILEINSSVSKSRVVEKVIIR